MLVYGIMKKFNLEAVNNKLYLPVKTEPFNKEFIGTRREGNVDCIAAFKKLLKVNLKYKFGFCPE